MVGREEVTVLRFQENTVFLTITEPLVGNEEASKSGMQGTQALALASFSGLSVRSPPL